MLGDTVAVILGYASPRILWSAAACRRCFGRGKPRPIRGVTYWRKSRRSTRRCLRLARDCEHVPASRDGKQRRQAAALQIRGADGRSSTMSGALPRIVAGHGRPCPYEARPWGRSGMMGNIAPSSFAGRSMLRPYEGKGVAARITAVALGRRSVLAARLLAARSNRAMRLARQPAWRLVRLRPARQREARRGRGGA